MAHIIHGETSQLICQQRPRRDWPTFSTLYQCPSQIPAVSSAPNMRSSLINVDAFVKDLLGRTGSMLPQGPLATSAMKPSPMGAGRAASGLWAHAERNCKFSYLRNSELVVLNARFLSPFNRLGGHHPPKGLRAGPFVKKNRNRKFPLAQGGDYINAYISTG